MRRHLLVLGCLLAFTVLGHAEPIANFTLSDARGKPAQLEDWKASPLVVVAFLGAECPVARHYASRLVELEAELKDKNVAFVGIDANTQDSAADVARFVTDLGLDFPVLLDPEARVADLFKAKRTPEVFLLDARREVIYSGRIDDQVEVGLKKAKVGRRDLAEAITEALAGKPVSQPRVEPVGCLIGRLRKPQKSSSVTYYKDVAPLLHAKCAACHRPGQIAPFSVLDYKEVVGWAAAMVETVEAGRMPPWFADPKHGKFLNDPTLTPDEKRLLKTWVENQCPAGDEKDRPALPKFNEGWNIPEPDLVVKMRDKPFRVPATGVVDYQYFVADPGFTEDKWVVASEVRPGDLAVVHHALVYLVPPGVRPAQVVMRGSLIGGYAPGSPPREAQSGLARKIPKGSKFLFQLHYTPNGKPKDDLTVLGLKFCDAKDVKEEVFTDWAMTFLVAIPPRAENHRVVSTFTFPEDRLIRTLTPHMHFRGKSFRYEAQYPDGTREILLDVPRYDFNWQIDYILDGAKKMPKGTKLICTAVFDNSEKNLANPDPNRWVFWGEQTYEEMMIGWLISSAPLAPK